MENSISICLDDSKQQNLSDLLFSRYEFRFNVLTEMPEFKRKCETVYRMVDKRAMNSLCIEALNEDLKWRSPLIAVLPNMGNSMPN